MHPRMTRGRSGATDPQKESAEPRGNYGTARHCRRSPSFSRGSVPFGTSVSVAHDVRVERSRGRSAGERRAIGESTQRESLERMARYMTRSPAALERVFEQREGGVKPLTPRDPKTGLDHRFFDSLDWVHAVTAQPFDRLRVPSRPAHRRRPERRRVKGHLERRAPPAMGVSCACLHRGADILPASGCRGASLTVRDVWGRSTGVRTGQGGGGRARGVLAQGRFISLSFVRVPRRRTRPAPPPRRPEGP